LVHLLSIIIFLLLIGPAQAGSFKVVPIKVRLDSGTRTAALKVKNEGEEQVTIQLAAKRWHQDETGQDLFEKTGDILFFPKITSIEAGAERVIRIGYEGQEETREQFYRLFLQELPVAKPGETVLQLVLTLSIPIFIKPEKELMDWAINGAELSQERLRVNIGNRGNIHLLLDSLAATGLNASGAELFTKSISGWYALPGISKIYAIDLPHEECLQASTIRVTANSGKVRKELTLPIDQEMCSRRPQEQAQGRETATREPNDQ
jgi:fimbrial chaperone protein